MPQELSDKVEDLKSKYTPEEAIKLFKENRLVFHGLGICVIKADSGNHLVERDYEMVDGVYVPAENKSAQFLIDYMNEIAAKFVGNMEELAYARIN